MCLKLGLYVGNTHWGAHHTRLKKLFNGITHKKTHAFFFEHFHNKKNTQIYYGIDLSHKKCIPKFNIK